MNSIDSESNNKRIAKNTVLLYCRTLVTMLLSLYTSRLVLNQLGVNDYGIYNVVGGVVTMFSVISSALSSSISRFITFELGRKNFDKLKMIFSTSVNIQIVLSLIILILGESIGLWFLNNKISIPLDRLEAANWVLQFSLLTFCVNLISVPYNSCIIAHEHMTAFAYISVLEAVFKLLICYALILSPFDKLVYYSLLMFMVALLIRIIYGIYCGKKFEECKYSFRYDKGLFKEMLGFAGWNFFINGAYIFNTQGVNLLINVYFGVALNAARGVATQVEGAVMQFVNNFTIAISPQITKDYAASKINEMFSLICRGAKISYMLLLLLALPVMIEADKILELWLKVVPDYAPVFVRLSLIGAMVNILGNTGYTACMATGNIKRYVVYITLVGFLVFPLTWVVFAQGMPVYSTYIIFIFVYLLVNITRLYIMKGLLGFPIMMFIKDVITPVILTTFIGSIIPILISKVIAPSMGRVFVTTLISCITVGLSIWFIGLTKHERQMTIGKIIYKLRSK